MFHSENQDSTFPDELKNADTYQVYQKKYHRDKSNYTPVSTLPLLSTSFEHSVYYQIDNHTKDIL